MFGQQRKFRAKSDKAKKRKAVEDEIRRVDCKRKLLNKSIQTMSLEADRLATKAGESEENEKKFCDQVRVLKKS